MLYTKKEHTNLCLAYYDHKSVIVWQMSATIIPRLPLILYHIRYVLYLSLGSKILEQVMYTRVLHIQNEHCVSQM